MSYYYKYLKYKLKYHKLKLLEIKSQSGGSMVTSMITSITTSITTSIQNIIDNIRMLYKSKQTLSIFELYQYNIVNYPSNGKQSESDNLRFTSITTSEEECPTFAVQSNNTNPNNESLSLCDIITETNPNIDKTSKIVLLTKENYESEFYKYLYHTHNILKPKYFSIDNIDNGEYNRETIIPQEIILLLLTDIIQRYNKRCISIIRANTFDKYIVFGDFHGSLHSFIRILFRLHRYNVLDITTMKLKNNYHLIFLGDIIDRGMFSVEILTTILLLLKVNNDKVIFIAGNHEASIPSINNINGFRTEMTFKYNNVVLYDEFNKLFLLLPVALLIHCKENQNTIWLSHGCFNASGKYDYKLKSIDYDNTKEIELLDDSMVNSILWSDINYKEYHKGRGGDFYNKNNREQFKKFMIENNISGVIRGHQDNYSNSIIYYHNNIDGTNAMKINDLGNNNKCDNKNICYNNSIGSINRVNGALARIIMSLREYKDNYEPIVTISTATDIKKSLYGEGFGLLRFDLSRNELSRFDLSLKKEQILPNI